MILSDKEKRELIENAKRLQTYFDKEEWFENCKVQVLTNTRTGEVSVGWVRPDGTFELMP